jgi:hypothetical protein
MTFQVALVGTDGVLIASDRRSVYFSNESDDDPCASSQPSEVCKIVASGSEDVVCAFAGSPYSSSIAKAIVDSAEFLNARTDGAREVVIKSILRQMGKGPHQRDEIIIARKTDLGRIVVLSRKGFSEPTFTECTTQICMGNNMIPARFIPRHFWRKRPIAELEPLALLTLSCAAWEEKSMIGGGFDFLFITADGFRPCHYDEDDPRIEQARKSFEKAAQPTICTSNS